MDKCDICPVDFIEYVGNGIYHCCLCDTYSSYIGRKDLPPQTDLASRQRSVSRAYG